MECAKRVMKKAYMHLTYKFSIHLVSNMTKGLVAEFLINNDSKTGIDLDDVSEFEFLKTYFNAKYMFLNNEIRVYQSSGGSGYHIEIIGVKSKLSVRRTLCDCKDRIWYSILRSSSIYGFDKLSIGDPIVDDVMFTFKTKKIDCQNLQRVYRQQRVEIDERSIICQGFWI